MTSGRYDREIAEASKELVELQAQFDRASRDYDDYKTRQIKAAIADCDRRLWKLRQRQESMAEPLRSSAIFYGSDH